MGERAVNSNSSGSGKPDRTKLAVVGGLAVILAAVTMRMMSSGPEGAAAAPAVEDDRAPVTTNTSRPMVHVPRVIDWPNKVARDPFASSVVYRPAPPPPAPPKPDEPAPPPPPPPPPPIDWVKEANESIPLTATVLGEKPIAMINGRIYRVGEVVAGFRIGEIQARRIIVERDGQRIPIEAKQ